MNIHSIIQTIKNIPYNIKYGIENLIRWFPVIWKDRDWDHYYLYVILQHKLKHMKHLQKNYGNSMSAEQIVDEIKICIDLLDRLIKDEYDENALKKYYEKWGRPNFNWISISDKSGRSELEITHENVKTKEDKKQESKHFHRACDHERKMRKQDIEYLFEYMSKHVEGWWD